MICAGFEPHQRREIDELIDAGVGGVALFARNIAGGPNEVAAHIADLKARATGAGHPLYVGIDQEGGRVARLREGFSRVPSMRELGATGDLNLIRDAGDLVGRELRAVGVDVNWAPCVDVDTNPANPVIATRSFGRDPAFVSAAGVALLEGLQRRGVAACAKHFPGHGDTSQDSHHDLPRLRHDLARLEAVELPPFEACIRAGVASVMSAHVIFEPLDGHAPATLSPLVLGGLLRDRFGFDGVIFTDDMEMAAVAAHFGFEDAVVRAVLAGADVLTICHSPERQRGAISAIVAAVRDGRIGEGRLHESARRIERLCERYVHPLPAEPSIGVFATEEHQRLRQRVEGAGTQERAADPTVFRPGDQGITLNA